MIITLRRGRRSLLVLLLTALIGSGCVTPTPYDYTLYRQYMPRSILVLPPLNESLDADASYSWLTTVSEPIAEQGYYVYPVAVIDEFMKENGLPGPGEMHAVPLEKIDEIIGADAVLYVTLEEFGQKFELLSSTTRVRARAQLVDVKSGEELWTGKVDHAASSDSNGQGLLADVLTAAIAQVGESVTDKSHDAARLVNRQWFRSDSDGLLPGPMHPEFGAEITEN